MGFVIETDSESPQESTSLPHEEITGNERVSSTDEAIPMGATASRVLKESTKKLLSMQSAEPTKESPKPADPTRTAEPDPAKQAEPAKSIEQPKPADPPKPAASDDAYAKLLDHNTRLVAELDALRRQAPSKSEREKQFDEIEGLFVDNPISGFRKVMSMVMGVPEDSKEIDRHEQFLETELTSKRAKLELTPESEADRKAARTLVAIQREMRARKAEETKQATTPVADPAEEIATQKSSIIGNLLTATKHEEKYPLLMAWSEGVHGVRPERLLWGIIDNGFNTGEFDRSTPDDQLIDQASNKVETYYQGLLEKAKKPTSTAQPAATAESEGKNPDPPGPKVGTISNAQASVAPATLPATKTPDKKTYTTEKERRMAIIRSHTTQA